MRICPMKARLRPGFHGIFVDAVILQQGQFESLFYNKRETRHTGSTRGKENGCT